MHRERIRRLVGLAASISSMFQGLGLILQFTNALYFGTVGLSFPFFSSLAVATLLWSWYAAINPVGVEWVIFVPNSILFVFASGVCFLIVMEKLPAV